MAWVRRVFIAFLVAAKCVVHELMIQHEAFKVEMCRACANVLIGEFTTFHG